MHFWVVIIAFSLFWGALSEHESTLNDKGPTPPEMIRLYHRDLQFIANQRKLRKQFKHEQKDRSKQFDREEKQRKIDFEKWTHRKFYNELEARMGVVVNNSLSTAGGANMYGEKRIPRLEFSKFMREFDLATTKESRAAWQKKWAETIQIINQAQNVEDDAEKSSKETWHFVGNRMDDGPPEDSARLGRRGNPASDTCVDVPDPRSGEARKTKRLCGRFKGGRLQLLPNYTYPLAEGCTDVVDHRRGKSGTRRMCGKYKNGKLELWPKADRYKQEINLYNHFHLEKMQERREFDRQLRRKQENERREFDQQQPRRGNRKQFDRQQRRERKEALREFDRRFLIDGQRFDLWLAQRFYNDREQKLRLRNNSLTTGGGFDSKGRKRLRGTTYLDFVYDGTSGIMSRKRWMKKWAKTIAMLNEAQDRVDNALKQANETRVS